MQTNATEVLGNLFLISRRQTEFMSKITFRPNKYTFTQY